MWLPGWQPTQNPMAAAPAAAEQLPRARLPVLRWATQNGNGLASRERAAVAAASWQRAGHQVVLFQELHLTLHTVTPVLRRLRRLGWTTFYALSPPGPSGRGRGGTAILIRSALLSSGAFAIVGGDAGVVRAPDGRYVAMTARWGGHMLHVCSFYMPNDAAAQRQFITSSLAPLEAAASTAGCEPLWGGDCNFVPDLHLDRLGYAAGAHHADVGTQQRWQDALPGLVDVYRHRHPGRRAFTYVHSQHASRLDRVYTSAALLPYMATCTVRSRTFSDHRAVSFSLAALAPSSLGPGLRRVRLAFLSCPGLKQELHAWLADRLAAAPEDHHALLLWWPEFKRQLAALCGRLHRASRLMSQAAEASGAQLEGLYAQLDAGDEGALDAIVAARQQFGAAVGAYVEDAARCHRRAWLHTGERPCPAITRRLRPRQRDRAVPALRSATGALLQSATACAQRVADFFAGISAARDADPAAQQEVLQALAGGRSLTPDQAAHLARQAIEPGEVKQAMRTARPGRSPGLDGIPVELYRRCREPFIPLLARLFTAIATVGDLPPGFHDGVVTILYKSGDRSNPANYRPITLLNADYRLYAKVLALRLNPCLADIIDAEQTAFVPGRQIGENIMTLQCLHYLLCRQQRHAVAAFCDFHKAYDTIDRGFLFSAMRTLGLGDGFVAMVHRLLAGTRACAVVNGHVSTPAATAAGVRQGCPLAPLLYLFVAQALLRFLSARGFGIPVAGRTLTALQYADDAEVFLPSVDQVPAFCAAMRVFGGASGQHLNPAKTELLPVGSVPAGLPAEVEGLRVVSAATSLGVTFGADAAPTACWPDLLERVKACYARIASIPKLSVFGRGFATAAYGISKLLYHAEFAGHPPGAVLQQLTRFTAKVTDRGQAPADPVRRFAGLASWLLPGRPSEGGFGVLAWQEHIYSRHAKWGVQLAVGPDAVPWVAVARELLRRCLPEVGSHPLGLLLWPADGAQRPPGAVAPLPPPLLRLHAGLQQLPPIQDVAQEPLAVGPWCWAAPLWGNPFFRGALLPDSVDYDFFDFACAGVATLGQLLHLQQAVGACPGPAAYALVWNTHLGRYAAFANRQHTLERIGQLLDVLPAAWVGAARAAATALAAGLIQPPQPADAHAAMVPRLGWLLRGQPVPLTAFTVRAGTDLLTAWLPERRDEHAFGPFLSLALELPADVAPPPSAELRALLERLWRVRWENARKEPFWRLVHNALPTSARMGDATTPCLCGGAAPADRAHHFWACPVAQAVVSAVSSAAAAALPNPAPLPRAAIWLARPPPAVQRGVWEVVCLAAVAAMDHGRKRMYALSLGPPPTTPLHVSSARSSVARFWDLLSDFVALRCAPNSWRQRLTPTHPFIAFDPATSTFRVHCPAAQPLAQPAPAASSP